MRKMHLHKQRKCRPDIRTMLKGTAAAIDDDLPVAVLYAQQLPELIQIFLVAGGSRLDRPLDNTRGPDANKQRLGCSCFINAGSHLSRRHELFRCPWFGLPDKRSHRHSDGQKENTKD